MPTATPPSHIKTVSVGISISFVFCSNEIALYLMGEKMLGGNMSSKCAGEGNDGGGAGRETLITLRWSDSAHVWVDAHSAYFSQRMQLFARQFTSDR